MSKQSAQAATTLLQLEQQVVACTRCPRLRAYCKRVGRVRKPAFASDEYWARPVPGFGDANAHLLIVGLAPAAHGANRTGRMFSGDGSDGAGAADFWRAHCIAAATPASLTLARAAMGLSCRAHF